MARKSHLSLNTKTLFCIIVLASIITYFLYLINKSLASPYQKQHNPLNTNTDTQWKVFSHNTGYSFQYPPTLGATQLENSKTVRLRSIEETKITQDFEFDSTISVLTNKEQLPLKDFIEKTENISNDHVLETSEYIGTPLVRKIKAFQEKRVDNHLAYFFHADPCNICRGDTYGTYIELSPNIIIFFEIFIDNETPKPDNYDLYNQILSTFKFIN